MLKTEKTSQLHKQEDSSALALSFTIRGTTGIISLFGVWTLDKNPTVQAKLAFQKILDSNHPVKIFSFDIAGITNWDSTLIAFIHKCRNQLSSEDKLIQIDQPRD